YLTGLNFIKLKTTKERFEPTTSEYVRDLVRKKLVGTEVVIESPNEIALQVLVSYPELSVENALRRMVMITLSMLRDAISALIQRNSSLVDEVLRMDDEVDRFSFYVVRQLKTAAQDTSVISQIGLGSGRDIIGYRLVTKSVERAADHAVKIGNLSPADCLKGSLRSENLPPRSSRMLCFHSTGAATRLQKMFLNGWINSKHQNAKQSWR
ncbi:MAG: phosphate uptake regulator PhoU, partial [Candidatus Bathyarchaeia archaeon]